jgi:large subunit ribosomal protein L9
MGIEKFKLRIKPNTMKVVLLKDLEKLGKAGEVKQVSDGYARNYLIPNKIARPATQKAIEKVEKQMEKELEKNKEEMERNRLNAEKIQQEELVIKRKAKEGKLFGSVTGQDIAKALKEKGIEIKESDIDISQQIKKTGEYKVKINFSRGIEADLKVVVTEEK